MLVVFAHAAIPGFAAGPIGVDVFFVISGFVITGVLLRERAATGHTGILAFYGRRARRIIPMATVVIAVTVIVDRIVDGATLASAIAINGRWDALFQANMSYLQPLVHDVYKGPPSPASLGGLSQYWSLSVEEQFYLVFPALFVLVALAGGRSSLRMRLGVLLTAVIVASFSWSVISSPDSIGAYVSPLTRAWEIAAGGLLATGGRWLKRLPDGFAAVMTWIGLGGILIVALTFKIGADWPGSAAAWPVGFTALVIAGGTAGPRFGAETVLRLAPFKWIGLWSYSIYLLHKPILVWATQAWPHITVVETLPSSSS